MRKQELDALLNMTAHHKTAQLQLDALLPGIQEQAGVQKPHRRIPRRVYGYAAGIAAAGVVALGLLALTEPVVVEGKTYLAMQNSITIDGTAYAIGEAGNQGGGVLHNIAGTNQYVRLPEAKESLRIMLFAPDSAGQPERKHAPAREAGDVETMDARPVYPTIPDLVVRAGPGMEHEERGLLYAGQCVEKIGMHGNWAILEWEGGIGYAFDDYLFEAPATQPVYEPVLCHTTEPVNVRALPGSRDDTEVLGELDTAEQVFCTGRIGAWSQIQWEGGYGYVFSRYLVE